jgi:Flp pilus assembly pilin Flp
MKKLVEMVRAIPYEYAVLTVSIALTIIIVVTAN